MSEPETAAAVRRFGLPHVALLIAIGCLGLDYLSFRHHPIVRWPIVDWQMYAKKAPVERRIRWRRFLAHHVDGRTVQTDFTERLTFLEGPYRIDSVVSAHLPSFLGRALELARSDDPSVIGVSYETRQWYYGKKTLAQHLVEDAPRAAFLVLAVALPSTPVPATVVPGATPIDVAGADFEEWVGDGEPAGWRQRRASASMGHDAATGRRSLVVTAHGSDAAGSVRQTVPMPPMPEGAAGRTLTLSVLARADGPGASVELVNEGGEGGDQPLRMSSVPIPADGAWHRVETRLVTVAGAPEIVVGLVGPSAATGRAYFDDVRLVVGP